ncbi:MAG: DEAD/DEAH box helicase [Lachnospiraceae bacterium]|nr:DEAD/DEAH box helicase [Lachnospiraceae bacterium]
MRYNPHDYQKYAIEFIKQHPVAAVFLDMGMGKSSITLTAVMELMYEHFEVQKVLVIAPLRVARHTWGEEIEKWDHLRGLRYSVAVGSAAERRAALQKDADIYIINRENVQWLVESSGMPFDYDMVVIDELSSFKNWQSKRFRSLMKVRPKVKRIVGLTGTPSSNGLMDLFAEFRCLDMGERLGRFIGQYRVDYFTPDKMNGPVVYSYKLRPGAEQRIYDKISDITISMKGTDYLKMPELISTEYPVYMDEKEKQHYEEMKQNLVLQLPEGEITAANAASLSGKLLQMANGAVYSDVGCVEDIHDRKLDALEDIIEAANGKPVLVAYWYKHDLERITGRLDALKVEYARISSPGSIEMWNRGEFAVGLIHPASAGHGLNLQSGGSTLVWFGLTWSLELYQQTVARLWRQGQTSGTVVVQHIITAGTIDERVLKALEQKNSTQAALIDAVKAEVGKHGSE